MGLKVIMERGGEDYHDYKKALKTAKKAIDTLCEITEDMEDEYGYSERHGSRMRDGGSYRDGDWEGMEERRKRR